LRAIRGHCLLALARGWLLAALLVAACDKGESCCREGDNCYDFGDGHDIFRLLFMLVALDSL
jgi:hypothetical protein